MKRRRRALLVGGNMTALVALLAVGGWDVLQIYTGVGLPDRIGPPMQLVAHRGDLERWPENTLEGIVAATELAVDGIEFDAVASADGTWWVMHDPTLDRTTSGSGRLADLSDSDIASARIDGGLGFRESAHDDLAIPTLAAVLDALHDYPGTIYVDVQHSPTGDVSKVVRMLAGHRSAILCRSLADAAEVKTLEPDILTYLRPEDGPADEHVDGWLMEAFFEADVERVTASELPVITYVEEWRSGEDETPLIRRAWAIGVHAFLTKQPTRAIEAVRGLDRMEVPVP